MSDNTARRSVDFLFDQLIEDDSLSITFFGGEPLLRYPLIEKVVGYAESKKQSKNGLRLVYAVNTNGTILNKRIADFLARYAFKIFFSIDGDEKTQDSSRKFNIKDGSFFAVNKNLEAYLKINPFLSTISVITPYNAADLVSNFQFLTGKGVRVVLMTPDYTGNWDSESFSVLEDSLQELAKLYKDMYRSDQRVYLDLFDSRIATHVSGTNRVDNCSMGTSEFSISPDGSIFPCVQLVSTSAIETGNNLIGHVEKGWYEEAKKEIIQASRQIPEGCEECDLNGRCPNYCGCLNYRTTGHINKVSPFRCTYERMLFPIADEIGNTLFSEKNELFIQKFYNRDFSLLSVLEETFVPR